MNGILYLCATPIGNLEDITYRAVRILREADCIAAEDTRHSRVLLSHFDIHTPLISYHEHNKAERGPQLIARLVKGENIALISDAGLPGISDPGTDLVRLAIDAGLEVVPVPGANAALAALVASGLATDLFTFVGFLPKQNKKRRQLLTLLAKSPASVIFYEAPHRLKETLTILKNYFGNREAVIGRELTKKFEEFIRGSLDSLIDHFTAYEPRGEFTIIVSGYDEAEMTGQEVTDVDVAQAVENLLKQGINKKDAMRRVAQEYHLSRREVYGQLLEKDKKKEEV